MDSNPVPKVASRGLFNFGISKYIIFALMITIGIGSAGGYLYYKHAEATITQLHKDVAMYQANESVLKDSIKRQQDSIHVLENQRKLDQAKIDKLSKEYRESRKRVDDLKRTLGKHDIGYLAQQKPKLVENIINNGTAELGKTLEQISQPENPDHD